MSHNKELTLILSLALAACGSRAAVQDDGSTTKADSGPGANDVFVPRPDLLGPTSDARVHCAPTLHWGFVTDAPPPAGVQERYEVTGQVHYWGPIREPLASSPRFEREVELVDEATGQALIVQYYLPENIELPIAHAGTYTFVIYSRVYWGGTARALVIEDPAARPWSVLFVGEPATGGQALDFDDAAFGPVTIESIPGPPCEITATICGQDAYQDALRFSFSTGAGIEEATVSPGETAPLLIFGAEYRVTNIWSYHVDFPCDDAPDSIASYLIVAPPLRSF